MTGTSGLSRTTVKRWQHRAATRQHVTFIGPDGAATDGTLETVSDTGQARINTAGRRHRTHIDNITLTDRHQHHP